MKKTPKGTPPKKSAHHPHDMLFKAVFKHPENAREQLEDIAPDALLGALDLGTLRLSDASFVDEELTEQFADVVLFCENRNGGEVMVPIILEHKSYLPSYPPFQIMDYQHKVWKRQLKAKNGKPSPIIPVIFYHGKEAWRIKSWPELLTGWSPAYFAYTPPGGYVFLDLSQKPDEEIKRFRSGFMVTSLLLMKHRFDGELLLENLVDFLSFVEFDPASPDYGDLQKNIQYALNYLRSLRAIEWGRAKKQLKSLNMIYQELDFYGEARLEGREEGREEGLLEGIEKGIEKGIEELAYLGTYKMLGKGFEPEQVADLLARSKEFVLSVQKQLVHEKAILRMLSGKKANIEDIAKKLGVSAHLVSAIKKVEAEKEKKKKRARPAF